MSCIALYECAAGIQRAVREDGRTFSRYYKRGWGKWNANVITTRADIEHNPDYHLVTPTPRVRLPKE